MAVIYIFLFVCHIILVQLPRQLRELGKFLKVSITGDARSGDFVAVCDSQGAHGMAFLGNRGNRDEPS